MKSHKYIFLSIILLSFSASIQGQIDLTSLENIGSVIGNDELSDKQSDNDSIDRGVEESFEKDRELLEQDSTEENFGYSQTQSFINPPQEKFFNEQRLGAVFAYFCLTKVPKDGL